MKRSIASLMILCASFVWGENTFAQGQKLFEQKCSSCHAGFIPGDKIKENFFEKNNTLLHLKAPTVNMLAYAIMDSSRHVGDPNDPEMRVDEIEEYLREMLTQPKRENSICDPVIMKYYETKKPLSPPLADGEYALLASYFMHYKEQRKRLRPRVVKKLSKTYNITNVLNDARQENKRVIVEAMSPTCHFCKKMEREVIDTDDVRKVLKANYLMVQVDIDQTKLPLGLEKVYKHVTPSFFILDSNGSLVAHYPGSWNKHDFLNILNHYKVKE